MIRAIALALALGVASLSLNGCAAIEPFEFPALTGPDVSKLEPGVSTLSEAIAELGEPMSESKMYDGTMVYQWMYDIYRYASLRGVHVIIVFDKNDVMVGVEHKSEIPY